MTERKRIFRGDRLRQMREHRGLSQEDLARQVNSAAGQIYKYENGRADPSPDILARLAVELQITADYLLGLADGPAEHLQESQLTPIEQKLLAAFRRGDVQQLFRVLAEKSFPEPEH